MQDVAVYRGADIAVAAASQASPAVRCRFSSDPVLLSLTAHPVDEVRALQRR